MATPTRTPIEDFELQVLPEYEEFKADSTSERKAFNVAEAVHHFAEWTYRYYDEHDRSQLYSATSPRQFLDHIVEGACPDLGLIRDIAEARKHRFLDYRVADRYVTGATEAFIPQPDGLYISGTDRSFDGALDQSVGFWKDWLGIS